MERWQEDPYRWTDDVEVVRCGSVDGRMAVWTTPTVLFPAGGGQPADHGQIGDASVVDVLRVDGVVAHIVDRAVPTGRAVVRVDGERRFDHMQQHTGQHLLTATLNRWGIGTTSFHLGAEHTAIELNVPSIDGEILAQAEHEVNAEIRAARTVRWREVDPAAVSEEVRSRGLPEGFSGRVRLVEIEGVDVNTCGGTHVYNLAELQALKVVRVEGVGARGCRLYFLVGGRVLRWAQAALEGQVALTRLLSAGAEEHVALVERALADRRRLSSRVEALEEERADAVVTLLAGRPGRVLTCQIPGLPQKLLSVAAARLAVLRPEAVLVLAAPQPGELGGPLVIGGPDEVREAAVALVVPLLSGKGGGRGRWQGTAARLDRWPEVIDGLERDG